MIEPRLQRQLASLEKLRRATRLWQSLAVCWFVLALLVIALSLFHAATGWPTVPMGGAWLLIALVAVALIWFRERRRPADFHGLVTQLEREDPELHPLLLTALEQRADPVSGHWGFLQLKVINAVVRHPQRNVWRARLRQKMFGALAINTVALVVLLFSFTFGNAAARHVGKSWLADSVTVEPGNVELERGNGLVVTIRFGTKPPSEATLVFVGTSGDAKHIPMERRLADPVFGASLREVMESGVYHVEYDGKKSPAYSVKVFELPALVRADATLQFPAFTGLTNKTIPDTLRISAVEGSRLTYNFQLNKPVTQARLASKEFTLSLGLSSNAVARLNDLVLTNSGRYALQLVDADGRTNRSPIDVVIQVLPDRRPDLKLTFPRGDQRVSNLQELQLQAEAADDFGLLKYGFGFGVAGDEPKLIELGQSAAANEKRQFNHLIALERLELQVDQVVSYFVWADDYGPDGKVRRTFSDMYFAEVRPYDEIFRADQSGSSGSQNENQGQGQGSSQSTRLTELQKQIVIATWKIQRERGGASSVSKP